MIDLFFDTETTGFARKTPLSDPEQPDLVQLAFKLVQGKRVLQTYCTLVDGQVPVSSGAEAIHGISDLDRKKFGVHITDVVATFIFAAALCDRMIAHNIDFDLKIMEIACHKAKVTSGQLVFLPDVDRYKKTTKFCTMQASTEICELPGRYPGKFKWPKLIEAYKFLVDPAGFEGAHDALVDVDACRKIFNELKLRGQV